MGCVMDAMARARDLERLPRSEVTDVR
jgi:hypothetical protein